MEQVQRARRKKRVTGIWGHETQVDQNRYSKKLSFYELPPVENITFEEFEEFAVERLKVLKCFETAKIRWPQKGEEYNAYVQDALKKWIGKITNLSSVEIRKDHISHYILRLAYCRSEDLRRWFLNQEVDLFRYRLASEDITAFLKENDLHYNQISDDRRWAMQHELEPFLHGAANTAVYEVPFEEAFELIRHRRVFLDNGFAYVKQKDMISTIIGRFRSRLSADLTNTSHFLPQLEEDDRLMPMLQALSKQSVGHEYGTKVGSESVSPADIPQLANESFPLCMQTLQEGLVRDHHLKHFGRLQYGLFLKGIGLTLEDALAFWRNEFSIKVGVDKFDKQYAYNIRYNYGKEGKRADYTPYSCSKIITSNQPGAGDHHGCPFKHYDPSIMRGKMLKLGIPKEGIDEISNLMEAKHYQIACTRYFELTHNVKATFSVQHPNQYYDESRKVRVGGGEGEEYEDPTKNIPTTTVYYNPNEAHHQNEQADNVLSDEDLIDFDLEQFNEDKDE